MIERPVWDALIGADTGAALDPGTPADLDRRPDVAVVGGGCVGLAVAAYCRRVGLGRVVVLERARLAAGATGASAGVLAPEPHAWTDPPALVHLGRESLTLTRQLDAEWDGAIGLRTLDCLVAGPRFDRLPTPLASRAEAVTAKTIRDLEPLVAGIDEAILIHDQASVNPLRFAVALARHAGQVVTGIEVHQVRTAGGRVTALETSAGTIEPGAVVFATGTAPAAVAIPHRWVKGHLLTTEPVDVRLRFQVVTPIGGALQLEDGRLLAGGTLDEGDDSPGVRHEVIERIRRGLGRVVPVAASTPISHAWCGFRPVSPDRLPVIDRVPGVTNAWFTSGHFRTGLLMAAATGASVAQWIAAGSAPATVAPFSAERFR